MLKVLFLIASLFVGGIAAGSSGCGGCKKPGASSHLSGK